MNIPKNTNIKQSTSKDIVEEISYTSDETVLWQKIFDLTSEPVWYLTIIVLNYFNVLYHLYTSVDRMCVKWEIFDFYSGI